MKKILMLFLFAVCLVFIGCQGDDGENGVMGLTGPSGMDGADSSNSYDDALAKMHIPRGYHGDLDEDGEWHICQDGYHFTVFDPAENPDDAACFNDAGEEGIEADLYY